MGNNDQTDTGDAAGFPFAEILKFQNDPIESVLQYNSLSIGDLRAVPDFVSAPVE